MVSKDLEEGRSCSVFGRTRCRFAAAPITSSGSITVSPSRFFCSTVRQAIKAGEVHSFKAIGDVPLVQLDVHLNATFIQENLG